METAYGFCGRGSMSSVIGSGPGGGPYSSLEPTWTTTASGASWRTASSTPALRATLSAKVPSGSSHDCPTCARAARWKTTSGRERATSARATAGLRRSASEEGGAATTSSPASRQASTRWRPAKPVAPVMKTRRLTRAESARAPRSVQRDDVLGRPVAVGGGVRRVDRARLGVGRVQAPLELAEHGAEQQVPPGGLGERAAGAPELREVARRRGGCARARRCPARSRGARPAQPAGRAARAGSAARGAALA